VHYICFLHIIILESLNSFLVTRGKNRSKTKRTKRI